MPDYVVYVRNSANARIAELDDFTSLDLAMRFNRPGSWVLEIDYNAATDKGLGKGAGIIVVRDGTTLFSGPVTRLERRWSTAGDVLVASGPGDLIWLERGLALPEAPAQTYAASEYDVRTGAAETAIKEYVDNNIGPSAAAQRRAPAFTIEADAAAGATVTGRARFHNLLELCQRLALAGGDLGFRVVQSGSGLEFRVYPPVDKTASVIFSPELGNLLEFTYAQEAARINYVIAGGGGEGIARTFAEKGDSSSITTWGRVEAFLDDRNTTVAAELVQAIDTELDERAEQTALSIRPIDTAAMAFVDDWDLGDKVTVVAGSDTIEAVVREVRITLDASGEVVVPVVGSPGARNPEQPRIFSEIAQTDKRVGNLERR